MFGSIIKSLQSVNNRTHFFAVAAKIMRRVLVNHAVARNRQKRGGAAVLASLTEAWGEPERGAEVIALDEVLKSVAKFDDRKSRIVELRFFGGLNAEETAKFWVSPRAQCIGNGI